MPVSKHRRGSEIRTRKPEDAAPPLRQDVMTIADLRRAVANPALDFPAKVGLAGVWRFQQLLAKVGDRWQGSKASRKDKRTASMLLCEAMDGEHVKNDDVAPVLADLLRPYCPAATFTAGWEQAKRLSPGTVRQLTAKALGVPGNPAA